MSTTTAILATPAGALAATTTGEWGADVDVLRVAARTFAPGTPEAAVLDGTAIAAEAVLTSDGRMIDRTGWCQAGHDTAVRYEVWTIAGRLAHGWTCAAAGCRRITQTG